MRWEIHSLHQERLSHLMYLIRYILLFLGKPFKTIFFFEFVFVTYLFSAFNRQKIKKMNYNYTIHYGSIILTNITIISVLSPCYFSTCNCILPLKFLYFLRSMRLVVSGSSFALILKMSAFPLKSPIKNKYLWCSRKWTPIWSLFYRNRYSLIIIYRQTGNGLKPMAIAHINIGRRSQALKTSLWKSMRKPDVPAQKTSAIIWTHTYKRLIYYWPNSRPSYRPISYFEQIS